MGAAAYLLPAPVLAQAWQCQPTHYLPRPALELPSPDQVRRTAIAGYILALSWSPEFCRGRERDPAMRFQCSGTIGDFGFILHGLWPEAKGPNYPQYCRPVGVLRMSAGSSGQAAPDEAAWEEARKQFLLY